MCYRFFDRERVSLRTALRRRMLTIRVCHIARNPGELGFLNPLTELRLFEIELMIAKSRVIQLEMV